ncbi:uncharacterized protein LOC126899683 [Daktulosphaira vitifoliae]|uniref:uncharacterized protein LOC126899683 n=1 Tax=Daktulosphaira vitifoliae TaxID=58002 RepID=UPI0021A9F618|nr:uncharacterized protein LOC126899683 [Daktulosphaira vitifoliae]
MMFMKYFYFFFFLTLVKSDDPLHYAKEQLFNCFKNCGLRSNEIITCQNKFNGIFEGLLKILGKRILENNDEDFIKDLGNPLYDYVSQKCQSTDEVRACCDTYINEVIELKKVTNLCDLPYEHLITDLSSERKVLPTKLHEDDMIIEENYDPTKEFQILVLSENTEAAEHIKMEHYY